MTDNFPIVLVVALIALVAVVVYVLFLRSKALPAETIVVEVEPLAHAFGDEMSAPVAAVYEEVKRLVMLYAEDEAAGHALPLAPFGGAVLRAPVRIVAR